MTTKLYFFSILFFLIFIVDTITGDAFTHTLPMSTQPLCPLRSGHHHTVACVHGLCIYVIWLSPSHSFIQSPHLSSDLTAVSLFHVSVPLFLFCLSVCFVHYIPHVTKIIRYLSFSDWLFSLSIIIPSPFHAVTKVRVSSFYGQIVLHCINVPLIN